MTEIDRAYAESTERYQIQVKRWIEQNTTRHIETRWINNIQYSFYEMLDGWTAVFKTGADETELYPYGQYDTFNHALSDLTMIEAITVPFTII